MFDPVSVAGLTIAVFEQLLKLSERTIQFVSDARSFDEVQHLLQACREKAEGAVKVALLTSLPAFAAFGAQNQG
jgi:hypothetical protein